MLITNVNGNAIDTGEYIGLSGKFNNLFSADDKIVGNDLHFTRKLLAFIIVIPFQRKLTKYFLEKLVSSSNI